MQTPLSLVLVVLAMLFGLMMLTACETGSTATSASDAVRVACMSFEPITYSSSGDTAETISQVQAHNRAFVELCPDN